MIDANSTTENFTRRALWAQIDLDAAAIITCGLSVAMLNRMYVLLP